MPAPLNLLFDLDGTLIDPKAGITRCIAYALQELGEPVPSADELEWCIGPPLLDSFQQLLGNRERAQEAVAHYRTRYSKTGMYEHTVYPEIPSVLKALLEDGCRLFVATSKPRVFAQPILDHFGLSHLFVTIHGSELSGDRSDKGELIRYILAKEELEPARTIMIGDRKHDVVGATKNGLRAIGILWGYGSREELESAGAWMTIGHPGELRPVLGR